MGDKGRGQKRGHYEPRHLANVLLAFVGTQPSESAEVAKVLGAMEYGRSLPANAPKQFEVGTTLHNALTKIIDESGKAIIAAPPNLTMISIPEFAPYILSALKVGLTIPRRAEIFWSTETSTHADIFTPNSEYTLSGWIYREATLDRMMIWAACQLWADTLNRGDTVALSDVPTLEEPRIVLA